MLTKFLIPSFLHYTADIQAALGAGDTDRASMLAHNVISTAGTLGAERLSEIARELQLSIDAGEAARWPGLIDAFALHCDAAMDEFDAHLAGETTEP